MVLSTVFIVFNLPAVICPVLNNFTKNWCLIQKFMTTVQIENL